MVYGNFNSIFDKDLENFALLRNRKYCRNSFVSMKLLDHNCRNFVEHNNQSHHKTFQGLVYNLTNSTVFLYRITCQLYDFHVLFVKVLTFCALSMSNLPNMFLLALKPHCIASN